MIEKQDSLASCFDTLSSFSKIDDEFATEEWSLMPILERVARARTNGVASCLDIGSGARPKSRWFAEAFGPAGVSQFAALEIDPKLRSKLAEMGVESRSDFSVVSTRAYDMSIALEVIEHLRPEESVGFLREAARVTRKVFGLTVPNFEYWNERLRALPDYKNIRWVPDHFVAYEPDSENPHKHKQMTTPASIRGYMDEAFPAEEWDVQVFRAWPWHLLDKARGHNIDFYFKVFGVAVRR